MPLDPSEYSVRELRDELGAVDDAGELEAILEDEQAGEERKTAIDAIEGRLHAVQAEAAIEETEVSAEEIVEELQEEAEAADDEPEPPSYPAPDADDDVYFDPSGAGAGAIAGHSTIHLLDDELQPRCGARVGNRGGAVPRSSLAEGIDECSECPTA